MITKGPIISYYEREDTWNVYLDGDIDIDDPHIYWCNRQYSPIPNMYDSRPVTFKEAFYVAKRYPKAKLFVKTQAEEYALDSDSQEVMDLLRYC
jgi:hypothetical protein